MLVAPSGRCTLFPINFERFMNSDQLELVAEIIGAYVGNNSVPRTDLPGLIAEVGRALSALSAPPAEPAQELTPAVNPKKSVFADYIVSLEDGKHYRTLKRHLSGRGMTPDEYRAKWNLPRDYPMVAASYVVARSELAKSLGLGRKAAVRPAMEGASIAMPEASAKPRRGRPKKATAAA